MASIKVWAEGWRRREEREGVGKREEESEGVKRKEKEGGKRKEREGGKKEGGKKEGGREGGGKGGKEERRVRTHVNDSQPSRMLTVCTLPRDRTISLALFPDRFPCTLAPERLCHELSIYVRPGAGL